MNRTFAAAALALAASGAFGGLAHAQTAERVYDNGPVWTISQIETKPGMFNDYMKYVSTSFRQIQEAGMKSGRVLAWKVLQVDSPRDHEPDVILMVEYRTWPPSTSRPPIRTRSRPACSAAWSSPVRRR